MTLSAGGHSLTGGGRVPLWTIGVACVAVFVIAAPLAGRERSLPGIAALLAGGQIALHMLFSCGGTRSVTASAAPSAHSSHGVTAPGSGAGLRSLAAQLLCGDQSAGSISEARARRVVSDAGLDPARLGGQAGSSVPEHGHAAHHAGQHAAHHPGTGTGAGHEAAGAAASAADTPLECLRTAADVALSLFDGPMLLAHLVAALALGWLLRRGEAALWQLVRLSARSARTAAAHARALGTAFACVRAMSGRSLPQLPGRVVCGIRACDQREPRSVLLDHSVHRRGPPEQPRQETYGLAA
ncbi:hypothetical protein ACFPA8_15305 [Streptomyces ovatisporus]|uniref:Integral membrane protein n=1 Tax=Streptomyces ovatisporus TaxID=1128682 RepID=A0ABV9A7N3_9ACTN